MRQGNGAALGREAGSAVVQALAGLFTGWAFLSAFFLDGEDASREADDLNFVGVNSDRRQSIGKQLEVGGWHYRPGPD